jgi:glycosyltransferase involved in cell wall biosynthesis
MSSQTEIAAPRQESTPSSDYLLSVVIPVYNEVKTLINIIERVRTVDIPKEIVLVDDGSSDGTAELMRDKIAGRWDDVRVFFHDKNQGKGAAVRTGFQQVTGHYVIIQDADLEYDPAEFHTLLAPILAGRADVVFGSRFIGSGAHRVHLFWHRVANGLLTTLSNMMTNLNLTDMEVCYKVFRAEVIKDITLRSNRFDFEPEITAKVARWKNPINGRRCRIYEVPVSYAGRDYEDGKKIGWKDGVVALWTIFKYRFIN